MFPELGSSCVASSEKALVELGLGNADGAPLAGKLHGREVTAADQATDGDRGNVQPVGRLADRE